MPVMYCIQVFSKTAVVELLLHPVCIPGIATREISIPVKTAIFLPLIIRAKQLRQSSVLIKIKEFYFERPEETLNWRTETNKNNRRTDER